MLQYHTVVVVHILWRDDPTALLHLCMDCTSCDIVVPFFTESLSPSTLGAMAYEAGCCTAPWYSPHVINASNLLLIVCTFDEKHYSIWGFCESTDIQYFTVHTSEDVGLYRCITTEQHSHGATNATCQPLAATSASALINKFAYNALQPSNLPVLQLQAPVDPRLGKQTWSIFPRRVEVALTTSLVDHLLTLPKRPRTPR